MLRKCVVSFMNECVVCTRGLDVGWLLLETMRRPGIPVLCILGKM